MADRLAQLQSLLKESPKDAFLLFALAKEYEKQGNTEEALVHYRLILQYDPTYIGLYYHLGKLLQQVGQVERANQIFEKGMEQARKQGDSHSLRELMAAYQEINDDY